MVGGAWWMRAWQGVAAQCPMEATSVRTVSATSAHYTICALMCLSRAVCSTQTALPQVVCNIPLILITVVCITYANRY